MPNYTLDELLKMMEPQAQRDKALIKSCIDGLGLYAAQQLRDNVFSSKPEEMRELVENLVGYWGLDDGKGAPIANDFLEAFDEQLDVAKSRSEIADATYRRQAETIYGLHLYGAEMVVAQGSDAMSDILDVGDLMKEIASYWTFEPYEVVEDMAKSLRGEVRDMLDEIELPGQSAVGQNVGYQLRQAILFENDRGFVFAHKPNAPSPYVTWAFADKDGKWSYDRGSYYGTEERAKLSYISRVTNYMESYKVTEKPLPAIYAANSDVMKYGADIPDEYKIARAALGGLRPKIRGRDADEKPSVLVQIKAARKAPKPPSRPKPEHEKRTQGPEL